MFGNYNYNQVQVPFSRLATTPLMSQPYAGSYLTNSQFQSGYLPQVQSPFGLGNNLLQANLNANPAWLNVNPTDVDLALLRLKFAASHFNRLQYTPAPLNLANSLVSPSFVKTESQIDVPQPLPTTQNPQHTEIITKVEHALSLTNEDTEITTVTSKTEFETESLEPADKITTSKKIKKGITCGHTNKPHYAKGLCNNCYHRHGRTKKPWLCKHEKLYAHGLCQKCYKRANRRNLLTDSVKTQIKNSSIAILNFSNVESP